MQLLVAAVAALTIGQAPSQNITAYAQASLKDATFTAKVDSANQRELAKINKDFAQSYRFRQMSVRMKEPFKLRLESTVDDTQIFFIINGGTKLIRVPRAGITDRQDVSLKPGMRQTALDFGLIPPSLFSNFFQAKFVRQERRDNTMVFDLTYVPRLDDKSRYRVWVDPQRKYTVRREWYSQWGNLMATFLYEEPKQVGGVWFPTKVTVRNAENKVGGVTRYSNLAANTGIDEALFSTR